MKNHVAVHLNSTVTQAGHLLSTDLEEELIMMSLSQAAYYGLDATARRIWELIATPCRVADLCNQLVAEFDVERGDCENQVCAFLSELGREGLIHIVDEPA